ncbi:penicillin-binding protein 4 [candidate division KSB3 bacterium]|uniref:Penicillin-binding protein 4 n=1 Tax=candidate division KSB3 bacterium TaxID=2044937 RepID=A0A2G6KJK2_9BACT|nr:MAG: penicillin-binding protein 4 [candidate division KSB3 bacterium]
MTHRSDWIALLLCLGILLLSGCKELSDDQDLLRTTWENGLLPVFAVKGQPLPRMNLEDRMRQYHVPGVSLAVIVNNKLAWAAGYGVLEAGSSKEVTTNTLFQAASVSKVVTAMAVLSLVEQGTLRLDEDVNTWLQSWKIPENEYTQQDAVTLRRLLSHSAGVTGGEFFGYPAQKPLPSLIQILDGQPPANTPPIRVVETPGTVWRYSGGGYVIVQQLLEDLTGQPFPDFIEQNIFKKLEMQHSTFRQPLPQERSNFAARGHHSTGQPISGKWFTYPEAAATGLWSTPSDLARLMIESVRAKTGDANKLFSQTLAGTFFRPQIGNSAFAGAVNGKGENIWISSGGSTMGFRSFTMLFPEKGQGAIVMTNADTGHQLAMEMMRGLSELYDWPAFRVEEKSVVTVEPERAERYAGTYKFTAAPQTLTARITIQEGKLHVQFAGEAFEMYAESIESYFDPISGMTIRFMTDTDGKVTELILTSPLSSQQWRAQKQ